MHFRARPNMTLLVLVSYVLCCAAGAAENRASMVITRAGEGSTSGDDFDAFLNKLANKVRGLAACDKPIVVVLCVWH